MLFVKEALRNYSLQNKLSYPREGGSPSSNPFQKVFKNMFKSILGTFFNIQKKIV